jgi:thioredoxin
MQKHFFSLFLGWLLLFQPACNSQNGKVSLEAKPFFEQLKGDTKAEILDVRTPGEFQGGALQGARNVDYNASDFEEKVGKLDKSKSYYVYCLAGGRSASAASWMRKNGFTKVFDLKGGIMAWQAAGLPMNIEREKMVSDKISWDDYEGLTKSGDLVLVDFYAPWCGPCKKMEPMLHQLGQEGKVKVVRINIDENKGLAKKLGITEIPVLKYFSKGQETWKHKGFIDRKGLAKAVGI